LSSRFAPMRGNPSMCATVMVHSFDERKIILYTHL
jgi:hypothetical protein